MSNQHSNSLRALTSFEMEEKKGPSISVVSLPDNDSRILLPTLDQQHLTPSNWPSQPEPLIESRAEEIWMILYDIFLCILPLAMLVKTTLCILANKHDRQLASESGVSVGAIISTFTTVMLWVNEQMVTASTIVFITIMSTLMRRYTLWRAQRGAYVSDLEQLHASISLPSTIKMIVYLRKFTFFSFGLLAAWSFYYLGSQASKREYVPTPSGPFRRISTAYHNANNYFDFAQTRNESTQDDTIMELNELFNSEWGLTTQSGTDFRGYLLVPEVHQITTFDSNLANQNVHIRTDEELREWIEITPLVNELPRPNHNYAASTSYLGRKLYFKHADIYGVDSGSAESWGYVGNGLYGFESSQMVGDYAFNTSYLYVRCGLPEALPMQSFPAGAAEFSRTIFNWTSYSTSNTSDAARPQNFEVWTKWDKNHCEDCQSEDPTIDNMVDGTIKVICNVTRPIIEIKAECPEGVCAAKQARLLGTHAVNPFTNATWAAGFFDNFLWSTKLPEQSTRDDTYIAFNLGVYQLASLLADSESDSEKAEHMHEFSKSMTMFFNSYFNIADLAGYTFFNNPERDPTAFDYFTLDGALYAPQYTIIWTWILIDYLGSAVLFAAAVCSFWLRKQTLAPDIFGYVSSLTRDNPYIPVSDGGSTLCGLDRAKCMDNVKIRIGDVGHGSEVGKIGIVYMHDGVGAGPLRKERKYL